MADVENKVESLEDRVRSIGEAAIRYAEVLEAFEGGKPIPPVKSPKLSEALELVDSEDLTQKQIDAVEYFRGLKNSQRKNPAEVRDHAKAFLNPENE